MYGAYEHSLSYKFYKLLVWDAYGPNIYTHGRCGSSAAIVINRDMHPLRLITVYTATQLHGTSVQAMSS